MYGQVNAVEANGPDKVQHPCCKTSDVNACHLFVFSLRVTLIKPVL